MTRGARFVAAVPAPAMLAIPWDYDEGGVRLNRIIKFVAAVLTTALLAAPVSAAGFCLAQVWGFHPCNAECPMMRVHAQSGLQTMASALGDRSCCEASTTPRLPKASAWANQNQGWGQVHLLESASVTDNLPAVDKTAFHEIPPPPSTSSYQALLCVFLV